MFLGDYCVRVGVSPLVRHFLTFYSDRLNSFASFLFNLLACSGILHVIAEVSRTYNSDIVL